jgi:hypothetical protein
VSRASETDAGIPTDTLADGDVVAFENPWNLGATGFGVVREDGPDGTYVLSPGFLDPEPRLARGLQVRRVTDAADLLGVDGSGDYHLVYRDPLRVRWGVVGTLDDCYPLAARGRSVIDWIQHVDRKRGWAEPGRRVRTVLEEGAER